MSVPCRGEERREAEKGERREVLKRRKKKEEKRKRCKQNSSRQTKKREKYVATDVRPETYKSVVDLKPV